MKFGLALAAGTVLFAAVPFFVSEYGVSFSVQMFVFLILAYSWNIIGGYTGYPHFGQTSFFGIGAYASTLMILHGHVHWAAAALASGLVGLLVALSLGGVMLRLKGPFFAISMFGLTRVWEAIAYGWSKVTNGGTGLYLPPAYHLKPLYFSLGALALAMVLLTRWIDNSRFGLQLLAIREDEGAADALGIKTTRLKIVAFAISAIAPATCGALYASYLSYVDPITAFSPATELTTIAMVLVGGIGTLLGPFVGAVLLSIVNEMLWARFPALYLGLVGIAIVAVVLFMPRGIVNLIGKRWSHLAGRGSLRKLAARRAEAKAG